MQNEGVLGLYRGFGMSIATFVPTSGIWWGAYGAYQKLIWKQVVLQHICRHFPTRPCQSYIGLWLLLLATMM